MTQTNGILAGLRVLEVGTSLQATLCARSLAQLGAEVIKVQTLGSAPHTDSDQNKKSVILDLNRQEDLNALQALAATASVWINDTDDLGQLRPLQEQLEALNPALVCADCRPRAARAEDVLAAQSLCLGIMAAVRHAEATGQGQQVSLPDADTLPEFSHVPAPAQIAAPAAGQDTDVYLSEQPALALSDADRRSLRDAFGHFATGVTVVTTKQADGTPRGFTANSFTSVSLDPPLLLVCLAKTAHSCDSFLAASHFAVNILTEDQKAVSGVFASRAPDKFDQVAWQNGAAGMPVLEGALAQLVCSSDKMIDAGDHVILLGRIIDHQTTAGNPLGYFRGSYFSVGLEDALVSAASELGAVEIGAVLTRGQQVLLKETEDGQISVPKLTSKQQTVPALKAHLAKLGVEAKLDFLYAVFNDTPCGRHRIYYQGTAVGYTPAHHKFCPLNKIPFAKVSNPAERSMLRRFCEEFSHGSFGIYQGDDQTGVVHKVDRTRH